MTLSALIIDDEALAREELRFLLEEVGGIEVAAQGSNGLEALELIERHRPNLVFLDVQMPGLDGFAVIQRLLDRNKVRAGAGLAAEPLPQIVFATAYDQYAVRAFDVNAVDYLLKPFDRQRVAQAVERARSRAEAIFEIQGAPPRESQIGALLQLLDRRQAAAQPARLVVETQNRLLLVDQKDICFAAIGEGVIRVVAQSIEGYSRCRTLEDLLDQLDPTLFWRVHRGFVVNIDHIREVIPWFKSSYQLRMDDKRQTEIPVSRAQTRRLREMFNL